MVKDNEEQIANLVREYTTDFELDIETIFISLKIDQSKPYTKDELVLGLRSQGFTTINVLDCFSFRKGIDKSVRWMVIARK